ncbi:peroxisomal fatty acid beta-oxidation multifunctional protein MFP2-like [Phragmites australis]|uniref:peroxisomal fatty acid beta-oxidation multifunctional protein MFP2-like n=1 Tax=Phragmites australis TaxID=29695 RepID=UPI002D77056A|nr:peroxisomal fatty acid beta-oxidation multifunctional protein MFP2-like [Phragmites australis]
MARGTTTMEVRADGVAVITISNPPVNALSLDVIASLQRNYAQALSRKDVKAVVLTGDKGRFCGGFDINAFGNKPKNEKTGSLSIDFLTDIVEDAHKPTVAAIDGIALGGGLEVAMVCHARISTPSAQLGLPELQLGIIPGMGGTQRLPRLVGLPKALEMMLMSKPINGREAHELGLVDNVASANELVSTACSWALEIAEQKRPWFKSLYRTDRLPALGEVKKILKYARVQAQKKAAYVQHPIVCIDVIEEGIVSGPRTGLMQEVLSAKMLERSQTSKSLRHVFFAQRATSKIPNITNMGLTPQRIKKAAIVGGGLMGSGIATVFILNNFLVVLKEVNEQFLSAGINRVKANLQSFVRKGQLTEEDYEKKLSQLSGVLDYEQFRDADVVIEAVIEDILLKQQVFSDLEKYCHHDCIFATNTSTIDLNLIGQKTISQDRIVGAHFFSPAHVMPLLEIVRTHQTSSQVIVDLLDVAKKIRKTPIVVGNCTGFAVNRMFFPYGQAAAFLVDYGLDVYHIDHVITQFGMPMGPFRLIDLVGFGVSVATRMQYLQSYPERCYKSMLLQILLEDNRTGESSHRGFYLYDDKRKAYPDPDLRKYIEKSRNMAGTVQDPKLMKLTDNDIVEMVFFPVVNEACRVLDEGIALKASDLDVASIMGMGFPSYRGGVMFWADLLSAKYVYNRLEAWSKDYGEFFRPCEYLAARAHQGASLAAMVDGVKSRL